MQATPLSPCGRGWPARERGSGEGTHLPTPHPSLLRNDTFSHKGRRGARHPCASLRCQTTKATGAGRPILIFCAGHPAPCAAISACITKKQGIGSLNASRESSAMHAIRKLREQGNATVADYEKLLAENVVFHSPVLIRALEGRAVVAKIFATSTTLREGAYTGEWKLDD